MSRNRRLVQGTALFFLLLGLAAMGTAAVMYFGAPNVELDIEDGVQIAQMYGIILGIAGLFQFIAGFVGLRAAKHDNLLKPYTYLAAVIVFLNLSQCGIVFTTGEGGPVYMNLIYAATAFTGIVGASRVLSEGKAA